MSLQYCLPEGLWITHSQFIQEILLMSAVWVEGYLANKKVPPPRTLQ